MGKTFKKFPRSYYRRPKGRKRALVQEARKRAVPPDAWDDIRYDKQCWFPDELGRRFREAGISREEAIRKLRRKFCLSQREAEEATYVSHWQMSAEDYARKEFERRSLEEQVAIRLRYNSLVDWHKELLTIDDE
jgi:hypothetical protein